MPYMVKMGSVDLVSRRFSQNYYADFRRQFSDNQRFIQCISARTVNFAFSAFFA